MPHETHNPNRSTWGRRCDVGCESWPDLMEFEKCLRCGAVTKRYSGLVDVMPLDEARRLLRKAQFNAFYARYCAAKSIPAAGPLPDWYEKQLEPLPERLLTPSPPSLRK